MAGDPICGWGDGIQHFIQFNPAQGNMAELTETET